MDNSVRMSKKKLRIYIIILTMFCCFIIQVELFSKCKENHSWPPLASLVERDREGKNESEYK